MRRSERHATPLHASSARFGSPSAPVDGKAFSTSKALHIAGFVGELTERGGLTSPKEHGRVSCRFRVVSPRSVNPLSTPAACEAEAQSPLKERSNPCRIDNGGLAGRPHVRPGGKVGNQVRPGACSLVGKAFDAGRLVLAGALHPLTRGRLEREHRQRLFRRNAVFALDVAFGRWPVVSASCDAARAVVPGVFGVAT